MGSLFLVYQNTPSEHFDRDAPAYAMGKQVCCAHNLFAESEQIPHLQPYLYFSLRTCRREKYI